jgi:TPR repeat protein
MRNYVQATEWFRKAAENGYAPAQQILAWMYFTGKGVRQDYEVAAHWLQLAAHSGDPRGQLDLGYLYEHGKGVPLDYVTAYMWYETALSGGEQRARERLRSVSKVMTIEQINRATAAVHELSSSIHKGEALEQTQSIGYGLISGR